MTVAGAIRLYGSMDTEVHRKGAVTKDYSLEEVVKDVDFTSNGLTIVEVFDEPVFKTMWRNET